MEDLEPSETTNESFDSLLALARKGDRIAAGKLLQRHRDYLLMVANKEMDQQIRGKVGSSDIVQESLLTAHQKFDQFSGDSKTQFTAWLRQVLINDIYHARRKYKGTKKRQVDRERPLQMNSSLQRPLIDGNMTPQTNAVVAEESERLRIALTRLSDEYQQIIRMRNWEQMEFEEIGVALEKSRDAARKLWTRAMLKLQEALKNGRE